MSGSRERITALDAVRGAALVGIVLGNVMWFSGYAVAGPQARAALDPALDPVVAFGVHLFVDGKFYALFSLLFGVGVQLMIHRARRLGVSVAAVLRPRLLALGVIGLVHASLVWFGDIISLYALAAIPLLWIHAWPRRRLVVVAAVCLSAPLAVSVAVWAVQMMSSASPPAGDAGHGPGALLPMFASGTYRELLAANAAFLRQRWVLALHSSRLLRIFAMFVIGMILARSHPAFARAPTTAAGARPDAHGDAQRGRFARWGLVALALASNVALALLSELPASAPASVQLLHALAYAVAIPSGCLVYAALLWRWAERDGPWVARFAAAGRLSLTHYVTQSLVMAALFYGCGWGLWGQLGAARAVALALALVMLQVLVSAPFSRRVGRGPLERLLRWLDPGPVARAARGEGIEPATTDAVRT